MKKVAQIFGFIGGIFGFIATIPILIASCIPSLPRAGRAGAVGEYAWIAILPPMLGIAGAIFAKESPKVAGILMMLSGIGFAFIIYRAFISVDRLGILIIGGTLASLLVAGGVLAIMTHIKEKGAEQL